MRTLRFYCASIEGVSILDPDESHHLSRVLRLPVGASVELFDGQGTRAEGVVESLDRKQVAIRIVRVERAARPETGRIILAASFAKGQRFDWLVEKCTELGVDHIAAVQFERTVKQGNAAAVARLEKITLSAAKQSNRLFLPTLTGPAPLAATAAGLRVDYPNSRLLYGDPAESVPILPHAAERADDTIVFIGPEGGFTDAEQAAMTAIGACPVRINHNVLRVETAAAAFCTLLAWHRLG
jgi:16S rRNA (uracil1498-N3)-methyltransferase